MLKLGTKKIGKLIFVRFATEDSKFSACVHSIVPEAQYYAHSSSNLSATRAINSPLVGFSLGA